MSTLSTAQETPPEGAPEWMVSFADMVTILMAFFVVMFSMAGEKDPAKEVEMVRSLRRHLGHWPMVPAGALVPRQMQLSAVTGQETSGGHLPDEQPLEGSPQGARRSEIHVPPAGDQAALGEKIFFFDEADELTDDARRRLDRIIEHVRGRYAPTPRVAHCRPSLPGGTIATWLMPVAGQRWTIWFPKASTRIASDWALTPYTSSRTPRTTN